MKIWPFDPYAEASGGHDISARDLDRALEPFRKIRAAVGLEMDIMVEFHGLWNLPTARRIARALEEFEPYWYEDPLRADNLDALATFAAGTHVPVTVSETIATRWGFREVFERGAAGIAMLDISWCGGISEAKKIADDGRGAPAAGGAARLHGPDRAGGLDAPLDQRPQRADPGDGARLLQRLVPGAGHDPAGHRGRHDRGADRPGSRHGAVCPDLHLRPDAHVRRSAL